MKEILTGAAALLHENNNLGLHLVSCLAITLIWRVWMWWTEPIAEDDDQALT